jgi:hypothetical protein
MMSDQIMLGFESGFIFMFVSYVLFKRLISLSRIRDISRAYRFVVFLLYAVFIATIPIFVFYPSHNLCRLLLGREMEIGQVSVAIYLLFVTVSYHLFIYKEALKIQKAQLENNCEK